MQQLVLASSSPYRRKLLDKLQLPYSCASPNIDESRLIHEAPENMVVRLAIQKAKALSTLFPNHLIIGSDQVAIAEGQILNKPESHDRASQQLKLSSGNTVTFLTGLCLYNSATQIQQLHCETFEVDFLPLSDQQIESYLLKEQPYDCAGSFKSEGLGISLFSRQRGDDPNSLIGLPLIKLCQMLRNAGIEPLA